MDRERRGLASLCLAQYQDDGPISLAGYVRVGGPDDSELMGVWAINFPRQIVCVFRGTASLADVLYDASAVVGFDVFRTRMMVAAAGRVGARYPDRELVLTGHSIGAFEALWASRELGARCVVFNPYVHAVLSFDWTYTEQMTLHCNRLDPVSLGNAVMDYDLHLRQSRRATWVVVVENEFSDGASSFINHSLAVWGASLTPDPAPSPQRSDPLVWPGGGGASSGLVFPPLGGGTPSSSGLVFPPIGDDSDPTYAGGLVFPPINYDEIGGGGLVFPPINDGGVVPRPPPTGSRFFTAVVTWEEGDDIEQLTVWGVALMPDRGDVLYRVLVVDVEGEFSPSTVLRCDQLTPADGGVGLATLAWGALDEQVEVDCISNGSSTWDLYFEDLDNPNADRARSIRTTVRLEIEEVYPEDYEPTEDADGTDDND